MFIKFFTLKDLKQKFIFPYHTEACLKLTLIATLNLAILFYLVLWYFLQVNNTTWQN